MDLSNKKYKLELREGGSIEFRLLSAQTADNVFAAIQKYDDEPEYIEYLFNKLTEHKYDISTLHAGIPSLVIHSCIIKSGIIKSPQSLINIIESGRESISDNIYYSIYANISEVLPTYKLEELKSKTVNELFELFCYAERVAHKQLFDTNKMKAALDEPKSGPKHKKGVAGVTPEEIEQLQAMLAHEELKFDGMPSY